MNISQTPKCYLNNDSPLSFEFSGVILDVSTFGAEVTMCAHQCVPGALASVRTISLVLFGPELRVHVLSSTSIECGKSPSLSVSRALERFGCGPYINYRLLPLDANLNMCLLQFHDEILRFEIARDRHADFGFLQCLCPFVGQL